MDSNIYQGWIEMRDKTRQQWRSTIDVLMEPELVKRGVSINSRSSLDNGDTYVAMWFCSKGEIYMEISASTTMSFSVKVIQNGLTTYWPGDNQATYDRENYTVNQLLTWLDKQPWIV